MCISLSVNGLYERLNHTCNLAAALDAVHSGDGDGGDDGASEPIDSCSLPFPHPFCCDIT